MQCNILNCGVADSRQDSESFLKTFIWKSQNLFLYLHKV